MRVRGPTASGAVLFWGTRGRLSSRGYNRTLAALLYFSLFPLFLALLFSCSELFLGGRLFSRPGKALHCIWRQFSIVNRLYFLSENFGLHPCGETRETRKRRFELQRAVAARRLHPEGSALTCRLAKRGVRPRIP